MHSPTLERFAPALVASLAMLKLVLLATAAEDFLLAHSITDDSFYYSKIASNAWALGMFPSFDGIGLTNGFHFLYQGLLTVVTPLLPDTLASYYRALIVLHGTFFCFGLFHLGQVLPRYLRPATAVAVLSFVALGAYPTKIIATGMECSLAFALACLLLREVLRDDRRDLRCGLLLGLLILARLDVGVLFALAFASTQVVGAVRGRLDWHRATRSVLRVAAVSAALVAPAVAVSYLTFGHVGTISAATKSFVAASDVRDLSLAQMGRYAAMLAMGYGKEIVGQTLGDLIGVPYVVIHGALPSAGDPGQLVRSLIASWPRTLAVHVVLAGAAVALVRLLASLPEGHDAKARPFAEIAPYLLVVPAAHFVAVLSLIGKHGGRWYWIFAVLALAIGAAFVAERYHRTTSVVRWGLLLVALFGTVSLPVTLIRTGAWHTDYAETSWYSAPRATARYVNEHVERDARVGSFNAGLFGYLAKRNVVNLDGLANNWELLEARKAGDFRGYLARMNIGYVADVGDPHGYRETLGLSEAEYQVVYQEPQAEGFVARVKLSGSPAP